MAEPTDPHFKVVYDKLGRIVDVEPLQGGKVEYKKQPMKETPMGPINAMTDTHIFIGCTADAKGHCQWIHNNCNLWYICW